MRTTSHKVATILAVVYFLALAAILFWPSPVDRPVDSALTQVITWLRDHGVPRRVVGYSQIEFASNILLFVPFGVILTLRLPRRWWFFAVLIGAAASGAVELAQALFLPQRVPALSDIVANTSGTFLGALLVLFIWRLGSSGSTHPPRQPRRASRT